MRSKKGWPVIGSAYKSYYNNPGLAKGGLLARIMARKHNIVWGTGSHTASPIPVFTFGPKWITKKFNGIYNNTRLKGPH